MTSYEIHTLDTYISTDLDLKLKFRILQIDGGE